MVTGTMYFIGYRLSLLCSVPAQATDFRWEIPITAVAIHVAVDPGHAAGAGVLVHIPAQGSVVGLPVIRQPDCIPGPEHSVIQMVLPPVGVGVYPRSVARLLHGVAEGLGDLGADVSAQGGGAGSLQVIVHRGIKLLALDAGQAGVGFLGGIGHAVGVGVPVGPDVQPHGLGGGVELFELPVLLRGFPAVPARRITP